MTDSKKHSEWILESIDQLRKRKARPDLDRICHMVERRHGINAARTKAEMDRLVGNTSVIKVDYKGSTSYRNAARWGKRGVVAGSSGSSSSSSSSSSSENTTEDVKNTENISRSITLGAVVRVLTSALKPSSSSSSSSTASGTGTSDRQSSSKRGVGLQEIENYLIAQAPQTKLTKNRLKVALDREVRLGLLQMVNGNYSLCCVSENGNGASAGNNNKQVGVPTPPNQSNGNRQLPTSSTNKSKSNNNVNNNNNNNNPGVRTSSSSTSSATIASTTTTTPGSNANRSGKSSPGSSGSTGAFKAGKVEPIAAEVSMAKPSAPAASRKGRPPNKRKRFKKTHGPDFVENYDSSFEEPEPKCDYCLLTSASNAMGNPEDLLICKDCNAKAHPSCMDYSTDLAMRSRMSPWQCIDCKTCYVCNDSGNADTMLFCDSCDKGYHMLCHSPKLTEKPKGKWVCSSCSQEKENKRKLNPKQQNNVSSDPMETIEEVIKSEAAGLPTIRESPEPEMDLTDKALGAFFIIQDKPPKLKDDGEIPDATDWSIEDVENYFKNAGFPEQATSFKEQEIDGKSLLLMKRNDVLTGLSIKLGPALKIYNHVRRLQTRLLNGDLVY